MTRSKGFTLIELMIVLVVAGVAASIAFPSYNSWVERSAITAAAADFQSKLSLARAESIKRRTEVFVVPFSSGASGWSNGWAVVLDSGKVASACTSATVDADCLAVFVPSSELEVTASVAMVTYGRNGRNDIATDASTSNDDFDFCPKESGGGVVARTLTLKLSGGSSIASGSECS